MKSSDSELSQISEEINSLTIRRQQLQEKNKFLCILDELKFRIESKQLFETAEGTHSTVQQTEIGSIDTKLKQLIEKRTELQQGHVSKKVFFAVPPEPEDNIFTVAPPPTTPAPSVIFDLDKLPSCPTKTQCPKCQQFITTEILNCVSSFTWTACCLLAMMGCVGGCCLIPFCVDRFKSMSHRCPRCRTTITTAKQL